MSKKVTAVCVELLEEGTDTWKLTIAEDLGHGNYKLIAPEDYDPEDETWQFLPGSIVKCKPKMFSDGEYLVAIEQVDSL